MVDIPTITCFINQVVVKIQLFLVDLTHIFRGGGRSRACLSCSSRTAASPAWSPGAPAAGPARVAEGSPTGPARSRKERPHGSRVVTGKEHGRGGERGVIASAAISAALSLAPYHRHVAGMTDVASRIRWGFIEPKVFYQLKEILNSLPSRYARLQYTLYSTD